MPGAELLIPLGVEIAKLIIMERNVHSLAVQAGLTPEQLMETLTKYRAEFRALDPTKLPEV